MFDNLKEQLKRYDRGLKVDSDSKIIYEEFIKLVGKKGYIEKIDYLDENYILYKNNDIYLCGEYLTFNNIYKEINSVFVKDSLIETLLTKLYDPLFSDIKGIKDKEIINAIDNITLTLMSHYVEKEFSHIIGTSSIPSKIINLFK